MQDDTNWTLPIDVGNEDNTESISYDAQKIAEGWLKLSGSFDKENKS
jgi:hypothetical protein